MSNKDQLIVKQAIAYFKAGDFEQAKVYYEKAAVNYGKQLFANSIKLCDLYSRKTWANYISTQITLPDRGYGSYVAVDEVVNIPSQLFSLKQDSSYEFLNIEIPKSGVRLILTAVICYQLQSQDKDRKAVMLFEFFDINGKKKENISDLGFSLVFKKHFKYLNANSENLSDASKEILNIQLDDDIASVKISVSSFSLQKSEQVNLKIQGCLFNPITRVDNFKRISVADQELKIACIMDDFTYQSYSPEADFYQLTPNNWKDELVEYQPDLLFIESAWRGKDELWGSKVGHKSKEIQGILKWCQSNKIPTVFWNKEDPVHFETFISTAKLFDHVFTTDLDCIHRYKTALGHNQVYFLPFACQPQLTSPIETYDRKDAFCFAGAYYVRYPERTKDLEGFVEQLPKFKPLEIYDRNYEKDDPNYQFPEIYKPYIVGTLPFSQIDKAYKGYRYAINLNSIKQSQSMFARRVYELLGSNTITISNFSRGVRLMFGDLLVVSDNGTEIVNRLTRLEEKPYYADKYRLAGLRKILREHTYQHRLNYIVSKVTGEDKTATRPSYTVVSFIKNKIQLQNTLENFKRQKYLDKKMLIILEAGYSEQEAREDVSSLGESTSINYHDYSALNNQTLSAIVGKNCWAAAFEPVDYYGANYLVDMALATRFTNADVIGKATFFQAINGSYKQRNVGLSYRTDVELLRRASVQAPSTQDVLASDWVKGINSELASGERKQAIDSFNYLNAAFENNNEIDFSTVQGLVDDLVLDEGLPLQELINLAEQIEPGDTDEEQVPFYSAEELYNIFDNTGSKNVQFSLELEGVQVTSYLAEGKHEYIYVKSGNNILIEKLFGKERKQDDLLQLYLEVTPGINISFVVVFLNSNNEKINHKIIYPNRNNEIEIPAETVSVRLGYRIYQSGSGIIKRLYLGKKDLSTSSIIGNSDVLLLTNHYPSYDDLYRNGFVHSRVKAYREQGHEIDIFRLRQDQQVNWHEFQDIDVITGSQKALRNMLESGRYRHVLVHFLDPHMWEVLQEFIDKIRVTVWVHGAEIHPWYRRKYNIETIEQEEKAKAISDVRMAFWRGLLRSIPKNLHMVFVSNYFANEVMEDLGFRLPESQYSVIHNPIDTDLFNYVEKDVAQRKKILSIRPFATRQYANDLSVQCIVELSKRAIFKELEFTIIGDGVLFEDTIAPLVQFDNVRIEQRFVTHNEMAALHKEHGIFLCPTRWDSQGVSRDEAMSSGLVPATTTTAAIPEFTDDSCAVLARSEDYNGLADGIESLVLNPGLFVEMSKNARQRILSNTEKQMIIKKELGLILG